MGRGACFQDGVPEPSGHHLLTAMQKDRGTIHPAPPSMQKRNAGIAHAGCVCLLQAPIEGNPSLGALPSRLGIAGLQRAVGNVAGSLAARGRSARERWIAASGASCCASAARIMKEFVHGDSATFALRR